MTTLGTIEEPATMRASGARALALLCVLCFAGCGSAPFATAAPPPDDGLGPEAPSAETPGTSSEDGSATSSDEPPPGPPLWNPPTETASASPPSKPGTPDGSVAARPPWASSTVYAPQARGRRALFERAEAKDASDPVLLLCRVHSSTRGHDPFTRAEPFVTLRLGGRQGPRVRSDTLDSENEVIVSVPVFTASAGTKLHASAWEADGVRDDHLGSTTTTLTGALPVSFSGSVIDAECRGASRDVVEDALEPELAAVDQRLAELVSERPPRLSDSHFGAGATASSRTSGVHQALLHAAALVGWSDPRIQDRLAILGRIDDAFDRGIATQVERVHATLPERTSWTLGGGTLRVEEIELRCGRDRPPARRSMDFDLGPCSVLARVTNTSRSSIALLREFTRRRSGDLGPLRDLRVADLEGRRAHLDAVGIVIDDRIRPLEDDRALVVGETLQLVFALDSWGGEDTPRPPMLLLASSAETRGPASKPLVVTTEIGTVTLTVRTLSCASTCTAEIQIDNDSEITLESFADRFKEGPIHALALTHGATTVPLQFPDDVPFWEVRVEAKGSASFRFRGAGPANATLDDTALVVTHEPAAEHAWVP